MQYEILQMDLLRFPYRRENGMANLVLDEREVGRTCVMGFVV